MKELRELDLDLGFLIPLGDVCGDEAKVVLTFLVVEIVVVLVVVLLNWMGCWFTLLVEMDLKTFQSPFELFRLGELVSI